MGRGGRKLALCLVATLLAAWVLYRLLTSCAGWDDHRPIMMPRNVSASLMLLLHLSKMSIHIGFLCITLSFILLHCHTLTTFCQIY